MEVCFILQRGETWRTSTTGFQKPGEEPNAISVCNTTAQCTTEEYCALAEISKTSVVWQKLGPPYALPPPIGHRGWCLPLALCDPEYNVDGSDGPPAPSSGDDDAAGPAAAAAAEDTPRRRAACTRSSQGASSTIKNTFLLEYFFLMGGPFWVVVVWW